MASSASRYLLLCLGSALLALTAVGTLNYVADPYGLYHYGKSWDWIHHRKGIIHFLYAHKAHAVQDLKPDVLILGNSRTLYGIDPSYSALPANTYNLALEGADMYVTWRYLQHAAAIHLPRTVILGTDIKAFDRSGPLPSEFSEERLSVDAGGRPQPLSAFADVGSTLFSTTALYYSVKTLVNVPNANYPYGHGFEADAMLKVNQLNLARNVFAANRQWLTPHVYHVRPPEGDDPEMDLFGKIVSFCAQNHIHLIVFIQPMHASMLDLVTADGGKYSIWVKDIVANMESVPGGQNELWDFTGYDDVTTESFPAPSETYSHMRYFWECSHFQKNVGDMVLSRILTATAPPNFGQQVNSANVQGDLDRIKAEKDAWHQFGRVVLLDKDVTGS
jgi:hypothetical protein